MPLVIHKTLTGRGLTSNPYTKEGFTSAIIDQYNVMSKQRATLDEQVGQYMLTTPDSQSLLKTNTFINIGLTVIASSIIFYAFIKM